MNIEIAQKIKTMLVESLRIPEDQLEFDSQLFGEDIGLDSIDSIEIIAGIGCGRDSWHGQGRRACRDASGWSRSR